MFRRLVPAIGLLAGLASAVLAGTAHAQVNIDQGKSPAEMFSSDCATCHKSVRGLAAGKNSLMLSSFLREHYTANREEAASLAAYVLGAGGGEAAPKGEPKIAEPRGQEPKEPKTAGRPGAPSTRAEETPPIAKPQKPAAVEAKHEELVVPPSAPVVPPTAKTEPAPTAPTPAVPVAGAAPAAAEAPSVEFGPTTSADAPAESQPGDGATVPRDNIPD